ncbi:Icp55p [Sugiyamaella lignohabitans]|uniref:Icp55p n=1 Tax=Sugiyamaella lignohabitans TaxID=796027 RepID=A0A167E5F1_9ASCO|nr:Icp55p [Sugiyamaella lignohabitans]ANB13661.1 Icp55p [Sugiyamaella lignohabitans]
MWRSSRIARQFTSATRGFASRIQAGQPIFETRPHLIEKGDLTPGISAIEYFARRQRILESLPDKSTVILPGNVTQFATQSVFHQFIQDPNFYYLTGFLEPGATLVLHKENDQSMKSIFFVPEKNPAVEQWEGHRTGTKGAVEIFNADEAYPVDDLDSKLTSILNDTTNVYVETDYHPRYSPFFHTQFGNILRNSSVRKLESAVKLVESSRLIKSECEIDAMRVASEMSAEAFNNAYSIRFSKEHDLHAFLDYQFRANGCQMPAYLAVVAGGSHALTIHYTRNDDLLKDGDLVLVDAAGKYGGYCSDISRTWPVTGEFSQPQKDLYQAVLNTNKQCIELCTVKSGMSLADIHRSSEDILYTELLNAGFTGLTRGQVRELYPHYIGHNLGIDVHDLKTASNFIPLKSNQVITIEPGVYVPISDKFPKHFQGIGIRIEDNVVVGPESNEVLTVDALKEIDDIEVAAGM